MKTVTRGELHTLKRTQLKRHNESRRALQKNPFLETLFLEMTLRCNERCVHCGSSCEAVQPSCELAADDFKRLLDKVKADFAPELPYLAVTGGEPLLRDDFFEIMAYAKSLGFRWGMTSNGTMITKEVARKLKETGMRTVSISIDGLPGSHERFRRTPGSFARSMQGVQNLIDEDCFEAVQVTTVIHKQNIDELDEMYEIFRDEDIDSWRVINLEPIGRALEHPELMLEKEDYRRLFAFIREKRRENIPVLYGCSHFLGLDYESEVRDFYFLCSAGVYTASVRSNGDIGACLDIERRPETTFGNILTDDFTRVWKEGFQIFRQDFSGNNATCQTCEWEGFCHGGACHSWDYDKQEQRVCFRGVLF